MSPGRLFVDFPPGNWQDVNVQLNNQFNLVANSEIQGQNVVNNSRSTPNASKNYEHTSTSRQTFEFVKVPKLELRHLKEDCNEWLEIWGNLKKMYMKTQHAQNSKNFIFEKLFER